MISYGNNRGVQVLFEHSQRINCVLCIPYGRSSHPEYFGTLVNRALIVFTHYSVVCMVFARVMTFVEYQQRHLGPKSISVAKIQLIRRTLLMGQWEWVMTLRNNCARSKQLNHWEPQEEASLPVSTITSTSLNSSCHPIRSDMSGAVAPVACFTLNGECFVINAPCC
jgi:hypothetical protein